MSTEETSATAAAGPALSEGLGAGAKARCIYPACRCPLDDPGTPGWCAKGLRRQWRPVAEHLPSHNATVLVWRAGVYERLAPGHAQITRFRLTGDGPQWDADQHSWMLPSFLVRHVTHWMPLPDGPQESA